MELKTYGVTWQVDQEAISPVDAAIEVAKSYFQERIAQGQPGTACIFYVVSPYGERTTVALDSVINQMDATQLRQVFESEHPVHDLHSWQEEVRFNDTILGYWEWVQHKLEQASHEA